MWEELKVYRPLDKKDINSIFKKFGQEVKKRLTDHSLEQTNSIIKIYRLRNNIEQGIFIEKHVKPDNLQVRVSLKPVDFYKKHKFTMVNIIALGDIMGQYRKSFYPLTEEWQDLAIYLSERIKNEIEKYFDKYDTYEKIIRQRAEIEKKDLGLNNNELLIYAAIKTGNFDLLEKYIDKKLQMPTMQITRAEFLKPDKNEINEVEFLNKIRDFGKQRKLQEIDDLIKSLD
jgi:hypothetical protein